MLKYVGKSFIPGIPARDLTDEEVKQYGGETKLVATGLYKKARKNNPKETEKQADGSAEVSKWQE
jgi:hypothetical protein